MLLAKKLAAWLAFALFTAATAIALLQPVHPDPFGPRPGLDRLLHPAETNAFTRLPSISASLSDLHVEVGEDGQAKLWAVGDGGAILHSPDGGRCWLAQGPWSPPGSGRVCGPRNLWGQMELIPAAIGAEQEQSRKSVVPYTPSEKAAISAAAYLRPGIQDPRVPALREKLRTLGYETGAIPKDPTLFDEALARAVREFQRSNEFAADGIVGAQTRRLLDELAAKRSIEQAPPGPEVRVDAEVSEQPVQQPAGVPEVALPSDLRALYFIDAETGWAVGNGGTILKSVDGGARWESPLVPYSIAPAPWYWAACLLSVALLGFSAWPQRPRVTERSVADLLASDRPLRDKSEADALDLGAIASSLSEFLRNRNTEAPLTVAATGDWGSGKTSLMNLLRQDLTDNNFRPVWFNAWHHQKGEQILASLFAHIREQSIPPLLTWRGLRFRWRLLIRRGAPVWLLFSLLLVVLAASVGFLWDLIAEYSAYAWEVARDPERLWTKDWRPVTKLFTALAGIGGSAFGLIRTMQGFGLDPQKLVTVNPQNRKTQGLDPGARARFAREFRDVTECLKPRKMVIFIDDLDRCGQHSLIEVLEAVNFLASSGDCFIVMGMSPSWVEACVGLEYEHLARAMAEEFPTEDNGGEQSAEQRRRFARNYLEKLINIEVPIPGLDRERAGVLVAPEEVAAASGEALPWRIRMIDAVRPLAGAWKPLMLALAVGYGVWFGVDLLHRPEKAPEPPRQVHWSTGEVVLSLPDGRPAQRGPGKADAGLPPADVQASDPQPPAEPAGERLARTLSELLGVEISIQADPKTLEKGLVLLEHGKEGGRWQVVLSEPKEPVVESGKAEIEPEAPEQSPEKVDEGETRRFQLSPGSGPESRIPAWAFAVAAILILAVAWRSSSRGAIEITEDSKDFQDALKIWLPWLMAKQGTPRSVKRFVNWLRYVATRLRKAAGSDEGRFPEPNTVALAAVHNLEPRWLAEDAAFQRVVTGVLRELIEDDFADAESTETLQKVLTESAATYGAWAGEEPDERGPWPPSGEHRDAFLAVINEKQ